MLFVLYQIEKICFVGMLSLSTLACRQNTDAGKLISTGRSYFLNNSGSDASDGSREKPWQSISKLNQARLLPGDTVCFAAGQTFTGSMLLDSSDAGSLNKEVIITSYGNGKAIINSADKAALTVYRSAYIKISRLVLQGAGRKTGNTTDGLIINSCMHIAVDSIDVSGYQKSGLLINSSSHVQAKNVYATANGFSGIYAVGDWQRRDCSDIHISYCKAENNPGDPSNLTNHSGNGILAGYCKNVMIDYCSATNNGWDMPRKGNGPVGIWCFEADSVTIQHCIAYKNKTAAGASDGGGFDFDGGVTNSVIQYCLSYENEGSGYGIFQYAGASQWNNNTVRFCISENDGSVSAAHAGVFIWNSSGDSSQFTNLLFYNNTIYNNKGAAISYEPMSSNAGFRLFNNIFIAKDSLVTGKETNTSYLGNEWYSLNNQFLLEGYHSLATWANAKNKERYNNRLVGYNDFLQFNGIGQSLPTDPALMQDFFTYFLPLNSVLRNGGLDIKQLFGIDNGGKTFNNSDADARSIGASY